MMHKVTCITTIQAAPGRRDHLRKLASARRIRCAGVIVVIVLDDAVCRAFQHLAET
jgi:hypothetical protein